MAGNSVTLAIAMRTSFSSALVEVSIAVNGERERTKYLSLKGFQYISGKRFYQEKFQNVLLFPIDGTKLLKGNAMLCERHAMSVIDDPG